MAANDVLEFENWVKSLDHVLGCVILTRPTTGAVEEIQAFVRTGIDRDQIHEIIIEEARRRGIGSNLRQVLVFELHAESHIGDRESLQRAAEVAEQEARVKGLETPAQPGSEEDAATVEAGYTSPIQKRPPVYRVLLSSTSWHTQAEVALGKEGAESQGFATGEKTQHGLKVLAQATLEATAQLANVEVDLKGASLVNTFGREAVLVLVQMRGSPETLGAALVRNGPVSEAAVRATLDALNRRLAQSG
jgi:hypothetical protein